MKKITLLIVFLFFVSQGFTQNNGGSKSSSNLSSIEKDAKEAANDMCNCFNTFFDGVHPIFKQYFDKMAKDGYEAAEIWMEEEAQKLSLEEQERIEKDVEKMDGIEDYMEESCGKDMETKYKKYIEDESFGDLVMKYVKTEANCKLTYTLLQLEDF